jgi:histidyl-tRNA synthetase
VAIFKFKINQIIMTKIEPKILKGTRDFLPGDMTKRNLVMNKIKSLFARFGYDAIETPIICPAETILGKYGDEGEKLTYNFDDNGGRRIALPYDLTVPFARLVAANWQDLPMPFKRYQIQRVWRAEKPQKGRLREFYQCDIDIIGTRSLIAEAEVAKMIVTVFKELGFDDFKIMMNSRRLLNDVLAKFGVTDDKVMDAIRVIDKLDKIGLESVIEMLADIGMEKGAEIMAYLSPGKDNYETLGKLGEFDLSEIQEFFDYCKKLGVDEKYLCFNPSLARGLDYYTGISFEVMSEKFNFGALCAGGRYDDLCGLFCNEDFSGVGVAFGFERIMIALEEMGSFDEVGLNSQVLVTIFDEESEDSSLKIYSELIDGGINSEIYFDKSKLGKQFKYADKKQIPFVIVCGPEEISKGEVSVKSMKSGKQKNVPRNQLITYLNGYIND